MLENPQNILGNGKSVFNFMSIQGLLAVYETQERAKISKICPWAHLTLKITSDAVQKRHYQTCRPQKPLALLQSILKNFTVYKPM